MPEVYVLDSIKPLEHNTKMLIIICQEIKHCKKIITWSTMGSCSGTLRCCVGKHAVWFNQISKAVNCSSKNVVRTKKLSPCS